LTARRRQPTGAAVLLAGTLVLSSCAAHVVPAVTVPAPAAGEVVASVILIGDAGKPKATGEPVFQAVRQSLRQRPDTTVMLFLGDNVYPRGIPDSGDSHYDEAVRRLRAQLALEPSVPKIFIPGNHDWQKSGRGGLDRIRRQGRLIAASGPGARLLPAGGCSGPDTVAVGRGLLLVLLDTEWWLFPHQRADSATACPDRTEAEVAAALGHILARSAGRQVIVAGHHPILTGGPHGGYFSPLDHLFPLRALHPALWLPLPIIGSIYPTMRAMGVSAEDMAGGPYRRLRTALETAFACHPPAVYAAGHEHTLQVLDRGRAPLLLVSGAGIAEHESYVERLPETRLALTSPGFMRADLLRNGRLRIGVVTAEQGEAREVWATVVPAPSAKAGDGCLDEAQRTGR
jgi:hypothetical protein